MKLNTHKNIFLITSLLLLGLLFVGCTQPSDANDSTASTHNTSTPIVPPANASEIVNNSQTTTPAQLGIENNSNAAPSIATITVNNSVQSQAINYTRYTNVKSFYNFTDPAEGAFTIEVPTGWTVTSTSKLIRPYIDAGVEFEAKSPQGQEFFYKSPYDYLFATPNALLNYAGFTEGSFYDPSGGKVKPMIVKRFKTASEFASEIQTTLNVQSTNVSITNRPDLAGEVIAPTTRQTAAELSFYYNENNRLMKSTYIIRTALVEMAGTGIWQVSLSQYTSPLELLNETELNVLAMQRSFTIDPEWNKREQEAVKKRIGSLSQSQNSVADTINSVVKTRSDSMDRLYNQWENGMLGVEDVYNTDTGQHYITDSGANFYWADNSGNVYGTNTNDNPLPSEDMHMLNCPGCQ
ncbi:MAG: hypothetical protein V1722_05705 [Candidatus Micrarchaeota archaeon]